MGTWGIGLWSDDRTLDIKSDYLDLLQKKVSPENAVSGLMNIYHPEKDEETGYLFWLAIALVQWDYGHLLDFVKERAIQAIDANLDREHWATATSKDQKKRQEMIDELKRKLCSENANPRKIKLPTIKKTPWKVGDVISLCFTDMKTETETCYHPFQNLYGAVLIVDFWELDMGEIFLNPVLALYDWIGSEPVQLECLSERSFIRTEMYSNYGEKFFWATDVPWKALSKRYLLKKIGHISEFPFSKELVQEGYEKELFTWGTIERAMVDYWIKERKEIPCKRPCL